MDGQQNQQNGFKKYLAIPVYVLDHYSPDDVARAMIETGRQKEPFYVFNMDEAWRRVQHFRSMMPRVKLFYAMKSNDTEIMLRLAIALGVGFDCASPGEIYKIRQLDVNPKSIIYAMTTKTPEQMMYAQEAGVKHTTFDTSNELKKLKQYWPDARLLIRIRVDGDSQIKLGDKFGCDFETEAVGLLEEAASLGLQVAGVAFHVGSICTSAQSYAVGLRQAKALFDHETRAGRKMTILDIGGGFRSDRTDSIDEVAPLVNGILEELFPDPSVIVIAEPGRYLSDSAFKLHCSIMGMRQVVKNNKSVNMIYLNDGVYGTMRYAEKWHVLSKFKRSTDKETSEPEETILWGPSCDSQDRVRKDFLVQLPKCTFFDWLVLDNHGAYTITFSTRFSSLEIPLIRTVVSKDLWSCLKQSPVFEPSDFDLNPDFSAPLPSTLPPTLSKREIFIYLLFIYLFIYSTKTTALKITKLRTYNTSYSQLRFYISIRPKYLHWIKY